MSEEPLSDLSALPLGFEPSYMSAPAFTDQVSGLLAGEVRNPISDKRVDDMLQAHGLEGLDPLAVPSVSDLLGLTEADWETARASTTPLLSLHAATTYHSQEFLARHRRGVHHQPGEGNLVELAQVQTLPLIHGMSVAAFEALAATGVMHSNMARYQESGVDAATFHGAGVGMTNLQDRELGLNQYVFFDFGRPAANHRQQAEITLVVDQAGMNQPGVFITERDIADISSGKVSDYLQGVTTPEYFHETARLRIANATASTEEVREGSGHRSHTTHMTMRQWARGGDGDPDMSGKPLFSTYEIKVPDPPGVPAEATKRVVVRDQETFEHLQQTMGDRFEFVHEPNLRPAYGRDDQYDPGNYPEVLRIPGAFERRYAELQEAEYQARVKTLNNLPLEEKEEAIMIFYGDEPQAVNDGQITLKTRPSLDKVVTYASMDELRQDVALTRSKAGMQYRTVFGRFPWFTRPVGGVYGFKGGYGLRTESEVCVIATVERSKQDPELSRILTLHDFRFEDAEVKP